MNVYNVVTFGIFTIAIVQIDESIYELLYICFDEECLQA